jgi:hypothetical protein
MNPPMRFINVWPLLLLLPLASAFALQQDDAEFYTDLIHSDLPLWGSDEKGVTPARFSDGDSFGCALRVSSGDWKSVSHEGDESWFRFRNYGAFHCAAMFSNADERDELKVAKSKYGYFVELGHVRINGKERKLWAIQEGMRPGSDYRLLLQVSENGIIKSFELLQTQCPKANWRKGPEMDVWLVSYCAINSRDELIQLAKRMAMLKPVATITWADKIPDETE